jgi:hypothetical protein
MLKRQKRRNSQKHALSIRAHTNDQTLLTIYTDGSKTEEGTGASYLA